jgi:CRP-like cAMP-binding protein
MEYLVKPPATRTFPTALRVHATTATYNTGDAVFRMGSPARAVFYLESGGVRLVRHGPGGEEVLLHDARAGEFFAEASLDSTRYHCDAIASEHTELLKVPADALRLLLDEDHDFARQWISMLARQLRAVRTRVERLSLKSAAARIQHLMLVEGHGPLCEVTLPGTLKDLARDLGLTHEALYRTLATLTREGVIEREGAVLRLVR